MPWIFILVDDAWLYAPPGTVDSWVYHGFMRSYPEYTTVLFPLTYYGTRLSWIVPGYFAYSILPPLLANLVLHIAFYYAAIGATYAIVRSVSNRTSAFLAAVMMGSAPQLLVAFGWEYVDGAVITYALVAIASATRAARAQSPMPWLVASGAALACMVHANLVSVLLTPVAPAFFFSLSPSSGSRRVLQLCALITGALLVTAMLGVFNASVGGSWAFFMPSVRWALGGYSPTHMRNPFVFPGVLQLLVPVTGLVAFLVSASAIRRQRHEWIVGLALVWTFVAFTVFDLLGGALLSTQYYVSWLVPFAVLVLSTLNARQLTAISPKGVWGIAAGLAASGVVGIHSDAATEFGWLYFPAVCAILAGLTACATGLLVTRSGNARVLTCWVALFGMASAAAAHTMTIRPDSRGKDLFKAVDHVMTAVKTGDPARRTLFWYGPSPLFNEFRSIASSYLFLYSLIGENYPMLPDDITVEARSTARIVVGSRIAILTTAPADSAYLRAAFARHAFEPRVIGVHHITAGRVTFILTLIETYPLER